MTAARVLLMRPSIRESSRGIPYLSGYLGCARVVAFKTKEPDKFGNEQWKLYVSEPEPKDGQTRAKARGQGTWDRSRDHDLPTGETREYRNERSDPRQQRIDELAGRFDERGPDEEAGF